MRDLYLRLMNEGQDNQLSDLIDSMPHAERIELREELEKEGCNKLARNLYYDYDKQTWIK
jgi:hypothetical protein